MITLCPYSLKPIVDLPAGEVSDEHTIPRALGGPDALVLSADRSSNSRFGETVDSDLVHDKRLRFVAATQGVRSRSSEVTVQLPGTIVETGDAMTITFDKNGMGDRLIVNSHRKNPPTGTITLTGFDDQFERALEQLSEGTARKNKSIQKHGHRTINNPLVKVDIQSDSFSVSKGLAKIAYLMTFRTLGDSFALSLDGKAYRDTILAANWDDFDGYNLRKFLGVDLPVLPAIAIHEHLVACYRIGPLILTTVKLFGGVCLATFGMPAASYGMSGLDGFVIVIDSLQRTFTERRLQEAVSLFDMAQRLKLSLPDGANEERHFGNWRPI
ncbi:MAG: HNH endonuclease [Pseudomonadota bacterium]|nr:HNH endonuclease [Pseudomonadota bacterium]